MPIASVARADHLGRAHDIAARPNDWPMAPRFDPTNRWYRRIADGTDHEVWLLTWLPGRAPTCTTTAAAPVRSSSLRRAHRVHGRDRPADGRRGSPTGWAKLSDRCRARLRPPTSTASSTARPPGVSIHVYGPALAR